MRSDPITFQTSPEQYEQLVTRLADTSVNRTAKELVRRAKAGTLDPIAEITLDRVDPYWRLPIAERRWRLTLDKVVAFRAQQGYDEHDSDWREESQAIARWLTVQRRSTTSPERIAMLDARIPNWRESNRIDFTTGFLRAHEFLAEHGRLPVYDKGDKYASSIARWLRAMTNLAVRHERVLLDTYLPGWDLTGYERLWRQRMSEVAAHRESNAGAWPSKSAITPDEAVLGSWLTTQLREASPGRRAVLDREIPGWDQRGADETWSQHLTTALAWFAEHPGQHPKANAEDEADRRVRQWLDNQKAKASAGRIAELDSAYPAWRGRTGDEVWAENLAAAVAWTAANGRLPAQSVKPEGQWLGVQKRPGLKPARAAALDESLPGWR